MTHGFGLERPALWAVGKPGVATLILALFLGIAAWLLPQLRFDDDINRVLLSNSVHSKNYKQQIEAFGGKSSDVVIYFERPGGFTKTDLENMRSFSLDLEFIDNIANTLSPFSVRFPKTAGSNAGEPVMPDLLEPAAIEERLQSFDSHAQGFGSLISRNRESALFIAATKPGLPHAAVTQLLEEVTGATASFVRTGMSVTVTGEAAVSETIAAGLKKDLMKLNVLGALLVVLISALIFRDWRATLLVIVPALMATIASLSVFALLDYPITVISNILPLLVLILGVADGMHLVIHLRDRPPGQSSNLENTVHEIAPACALSAVTTAIAFLAVSISDNAQIREFAIAGALSVMLGYFAVIVTFVVLSKVLKTVPRKSVQARSVLDKVLAFACKLVLSKTRQIILISLGLMVLGGWGYSTTQSWFPYEGNLPSTSPLQSANKRISAEFGGTYRLWSELDTSGSNGLETDAGWRRLQLLTAELQAAAPEYTTISMATVAKWLGTPERLPTGEELLGAPEGLLSQLVSPSGTIARVLTFVPEPMQNNQTLSTYDKLELTAGAAGASRVVGLPQIMRHEAIGIVRQLGQGLLLACGLSALLIAMAFRNGRLAVLLLVPNVLPLLLTATALHVMGGGLMTPTAVLALTVAFGIAINDSVHCVNRLRFEREKGSSLNDALESTISQTGRVMTLTTLLLSAGLLVTQFSVFQPVQLFGQMLMITFIVALLADLIILPALIKLKWSAL